MNEETARDLANDICDLADGYRVADALPPTWPREWDKWTVILATPGQVWCVEEARPADQKRPAVLGLGSRN